MAAIEALREFIIAEWRWLLLYIMIGFVMYWTALVVEPTLDIQKQQLKQAEVAIEQNRLIIENQNQNAKIINEQINQSRYNQQQSIAYLLRSMNQSNIIGNQTADEIQKSIAEVKLLEQNITTKNDIQRAQIVTDITTALEHIDNQLDGLSRQHENITSNQNELKQSQSEMKQMQNETGQETGKISGFLGGPLILNNTIPLEFGMPNLNQSNMTETP